MIKLKLILMGILSLFLISCTPPPSEDAPIALIVQSCPLNITPSIFLYPAINYNSFTPEFFNDTEYNIFRNGNYLGKFNGNRFNISFLNVTFGDTLQMLISAKSDYCYVPKEEIFYDVECKTLDYITPKLRCAEDIKLIIIDDEYIPLKELNYTLKTNSDKTQTQLDITIYNKGRYNFFGCSYSRQYFGDMLILSKYTNLQREYGAYARDKYKIVDVYNLKDIDNFKLLFVAYSQFEPDFNDTITCGLFDEEWFIQNYEIKKGFSDRHNNDVGNKDIIFNFTLQYKN